MAFSLQGHNHSIGHVSAISKPFANSIEHKFQVFLMIFILLSLTKNNYKYV